MEKQLEKKKKKPFKNYGKSNKELNALIEKKFQKFVKNKKSRKTEKEHQYFQEMQISPALQRVKNAEKSQPPVLNEKWARTNYLLHVQMIIVIK